KRASTIDKNGGMETLIQKGPTRKVEGRTVFHFDQVFDEDTQTPLLYKSIARPMVRSVLNGKHATIFAYGQTGSGKTFTMQGDGRSHGGQAGVIQLVASDLFRFMRQGEAARREFIVKVSYFEIYNEKVRDLLSEDPDGALSTGSRDKLNTSSGSGNSGNEVKIRTNSSGEVVMDVTQPEVANVDEVLDLLVDGNAQRVVAATDMNEHSSRSHAVFRLTVESRNPDEPLHLDSPVPEVVRVADFNLVDLAGSESVKLSNSNTVARQREAGKINKSLLALTTVIQSLSLPPKKRPKHINYRDSKLTRILQPHLSGNAEMAILCCASSSKVHMEETRSTLKFAARAKLVEMKPKVNEVLDDTATIKKLQHELMEARKLIDDMQLQMQQASENRSSSTMGDSSDEVSLGYEDVKEPLRKERQSSSRDHEREVETVPISDGPSNDLGGVSKHSTASLEMEDVFGASESSSYAASAQEKMSSSATGFQLDAANPRIAKKTVRRYMKGDMKSVASDDFFTFSASINNDSNLQRLQSEISRATGQEIVILTPDREFGMNGSQQESFDTPDKRNDVTAQTEVESFEGPDASFSEVSHRMGSFVSSPETIQGPRFVAQARTEPVKTGGLRRTVSWDTMDLDTMNKRQVGQPLRALQSLTSTAHPIPDEVMIVNTCHDGETKGCLSEQLEDANRRIKFLENRLEKADDIIEDAFRDLERARMCIHDLVQRNVEMKGELRLKRREDTKEAYEVGEVRVEQYWLLKGSMYMSLFFFISGGHELFLASVFFVWISLETNLTA
ncbi:MAG: hypothetical protein SGILL_008771, partial [Bacillariaceae sp.]